MVGSFETLPHPETVLRQYFYSLGLEGHCLGLGHGNEPQFSSWHLLSCSHHW